MKIEVGKKYELNNGEIAECTRMHDRDPSSVDSYGYGPFVVGGFLYRQDGTFADGNAPEFNVKREVLTIQPGKCYKTRDGRKVFVGDDDGSETPFKVFGAHDGDEYIWYHLNGQPNVELDGDQTIISEWPTPERDPELTSPYGDNNHPLPPTTGTLKELNVKPGDVVSYSGIDEYEVGEDQHLIKVDTGNDCGKYALWDTCSSFRIISRASDTPKTWSEMTDAEKGALLLAHHEGKVIEARIPEIDHTGEIVSYNLNLSHRFTDGISYRIRREPNRETVTIFTGEPNGVWGWTADNSPCGRTHSITFTTTDGKPDLDSINMEALG